MRAKRFKFVLLVIVVLVILALVGGTIGFAVFELQRKTPTPTVVCPTACCYTIEVQIVVNIDSEKDLELLEAVFNYLEEEGYACCTSVNSQ